MKIPDFMAALKREVQDLVFPRCNSGEALALGFQLGMFIMRYGSPTDAELKQAAQMGAITETGELNIDLIEQALLSGIKWPWKWGPFKLDENDLKNIFKGIREH